MHNDSNISRKSSTWWVRFSFLHVFFLILFHYLTNTRSLSLCIAQRHFQNLSKIRPKGIIPYQEKPYQIVRSCILYYDDTHTRTHAYHRKVLATNCTGKSSWSKICRYFHIRTFSISGIQGSSFTV